MTEKQIGGNGMAKRQPTVLRVPENGAGDPFFGRQGNWFEVIFESSYDGFYITDGNAITLPLNKSYETISGLRMVAASNGTVIAAGWSGKIKTSCTMVGLIAMMVLPNLPTLDLVVNIVILVTTVYSGVEYFCKNWACLGLAKKA